MEKSREFDELIRVRPSAFVLLAVIVQRAKKLPTDYDSGTEVGEAFIGDYSTYGASEQNYRTDKSYLKKFGLVTFRTTNRGTIAKVEDTSIFDIRRSYLTDKLTSEQHPNNRQSTIKQEVRIKKKDEEASQATEKIAFFQNDPISVSEPDHTLSKEDYWNKYAPYIAEELGIEDSSTKYMNGMEEWLKKSDFKTKGSIKGFLLQANDFDKNEKY